MKELTIRYSELATLMDCQLKHKITYASGLVSAPSRRLVLGSAFHALMQGHYESFRDDDARKQVRDLNRARQKAVRRLSEYVHGEGAQHFDDEMKILLQWMYSGYVDRWQTEDEFDRFTIIDEKRIVPMLTYRSVKVSLQVTADLVAHHRSWDRWLLIDHKTSTRGDVSKDVIKKENDLDPQRALYAISFSMLGPKKGRIPVFGAYHNVVRAEQLKREMTMEERFARHPVFYNTTILEAVWEEMKIVAKRAVEIHLGIGAPIYSSPDPGTCSWKCSFVQTHLTARATGRDPAEVAIDYGAVRAEGWLPLADR